MQNVNIKMQNDNVKYKIKRRSILTFDHFGF